MTYSETPPEVFPTSVFSQLNLASFTGLSPFRT